MIEDLFTPSTSTQQRLEDLYVDSLLWESNDIVKGRPVAPVGTIKKIGDTEYIKTNDGWRYNKKQQSSSKPEEQSNKKPSKVDDTNPQQNKQTETSIQEGHEVTAPDGTKGKVISNDGKSATISYVKDGEKKEAQVSSQLLEQRKQQGELQHHSSPSTLKDHHKQYVEDAHTEGKSATHIISRLKEQGVDEDEAMEHIVNHRKSLKDKKQDERGVESKESHEKRGFDEGKGDEDVTGKSEKLPKDDKEDEHEDHDSSISHQAKNETNHQNYLETRKSLEEQEGFSEKVDTQTTTPKVEDEDKETKEVNKRFATFGRNVRNLINGGMKSMIAYGTGGVGKTYTVTKELEKAGKKAFEVGIHEPGDDDYDYVKITGKVTATDLYKKLMDHNGKIVVFDDCDSVLQDKDAQNLFKGALDTSGDGTINWGSARPPKDENGKPLPNAFKFEGKCIFISNLDVKDEKMGKTLQPIISRGTGIDLSMSSKQTLKRIKSIASNPKTGKLDNLQFPGVSYTEKDMKEVLNYLDKNKANKNLELNVRTIGALLGIKKEAEKDGVNWEEDADFHALKKSEQLDMFSQKLSRINSSYGKGRNEIQKSKVIDKWNEYYQTSQLTKSEVYRENHDEEEGDAPEMKSKQKLEKAFNILEKSNPHQHSYITKYWEKGKWVYNYGNHYNGSQKADELNYSEKELNRQEQLANIISDGKEKIEKRLKIYDEKSSQISTNQQDIQSILNNDGGMKSAPTYHKEGQNKKLQKEKEELLNQVNKLHNNLITILER